MSKLFGIAEHQNVGSSKKFDHKYQWWPNDFRPVDIVELKVKIYYLENGEMGWGKTLIGLFRLEQAPSDDYPTHY